MIQSIGYRFSKASKQWLAAFAILSSGVSAQASEIKEHYELLNLEQVREREAASEASGDIQAFQEYDLAERALRETAEGLRATPHDLPDDFDERLFTQDDTGELYKVVNPAADFDWTEFLIAQKTAQVKAEKVEPGTVVQTVLSNGHVETTKTAGAEGGYRVTNPTGEQYLVDTKKFESIYDLENSKDGVYTPLPDPRKVLTVDQNIAFTAPWGTPMYIKSGGVLVHGGMKDIYGIAPDEFEETYSLDM